MTRRSALALAVLRAGCAAHANANEARVVLPPPPTTTESDAGATEPDACRPEALAPVDVNDGEPDPRQLTESVERARVFAERCCVGDSAETATVTVTLGPEGYSTDVTVEPSAVSETPSGACLRGSFHRVTTRAFRGSPRVTRVLVHLR